MNRVLIIDDQESVRSAVRMTLKYEDFEVFEADRGEAGLERLRAESGIGVVLCDVKMPGKDGLETLEEIRDLRPGLPVIMISGHADIGTAVQATRSGAFDFLEKPLERDRLLLTLRNALGARDLSRQNASLRRRVAERFEIVGSSPPMQALKRTIERVADTDARILITGENGTGKELVARNLHLLSGRSDAPFVDVNCAAIPGELIESELFGHEKGAFTGADAARAGRFEQADRGTLFLDEIGDMPLAAQAKVLRVLQENRVQRVGGRGDLAVDVRVLAATNKDLEEEVKEGRFREDLYYRLAVIPIEVPPLRDRGGDVAELFTRFLVEACKKHGRPVLKLTSEATHHLADQPWPGNVRELRNLAERAALLASEDTLDARALTRLGTRDVLPGGHSSLFDIESFEVFKETAERLFLERKLEENGWNVKRTAESLGMQRSNLYKKIDRYDLRTNGPA